MYVFIRLIKILFLSFLGKKQKFDEVGKITLMCWPNDLDTNFHMNNGRYMTLLDLARADFMIRTDMFKIVLKHKWMPVLASAKVEYKKPVHLWENFDIHTKLLGHDEKRFYIEHMMFNKKGNLLFKATVKAAFVKNRKSVPVKEVFDAAGVDYVLHDLPKSVQLWLDSERV